MKIQSNKLYLTITLFLFLIEVIIVTLLTHGFIRHTFGDFLVVILIYCFFKSFIEVNSIILALLVLLFAFTIEFLQLANILETLHLQNNHVIKLILGNSFQISDLVAYTLGIVTILLIDLNTKPNE